MRRLVVGAAGAVALVAALPGAAAAQSSPWLPRLRLDNDAYNFWVHPARRSDEEYTNGMVASLETLRAPWWGRRLGGGAPGCAGDAGSGPCLATVLSLGHEMYTPDLARPPFSTPDWEDERPYAAWLYLSAEGRRISPRALRTYTLALGVTGEPALGKPAQAIAHYLVRTYAARATGWETQVGFEPGVLAGVRQSLLAVRATAGGRGVFDLVPHAGATVGNILTAGDGGVKARLGVNLSHPWDPRAWRNRPGWEMHVSAAARREYVVHNFSLDGTLLNPDRHVDRVPGVGEYEIGATLRIQRLSLGYRVITRGREYTTGPAQHRFSSMSAGVEFFR